MLDDSVSRLSCSGLSLIIRAKDRSCLKIVLTTTPAFVVERGPIPRVTLIAILAPVSVFVGPKTLSWAGPMRTRPTQQCPDAPAATLPDFSFEDSRWSRSLLVGERKEWVSCASEASQLSKA
ncbi:hypothetical protein PG991_009155 [Apiospora marii]|uniref:Uncharacterized protein n=1 Tax=Apiospora marii TaxID=335849 RepID=A0ABR1RJV7_9PEZI